MRWNHVSTSHKRYASNPRNSAFHPGSNVPPLGDEDAIKDISTSLQTAQLDGADDNQHGSALVDSKEADVEVKLSDMQADPDNPLFSVTSFDKLGVYDAQLLM